MARSVGSVSVSVVPDATGFVPKLKADVEAGTKEIGDSIGRNIGSSMSDSISPYIDEIRLKLDELGTKDVNIRVRIDDNGGIARTEAELAAVDASAGSGGNGFNLFGSKIANIGALAVGAADVAIPAILAIGAAAAGALAVVGVLALGFSGIGAALQAHGQPTPGGGTGVSGAGLSQQSAQLAATQATQSAQDQLTQAIQSQAKAEVALHLARVQALQDLQDLDNKLKDNTLSQKQAAIDLVTAKQTLAVTLNAPGASLAQYTQQVAQAQLNVATAQQKVNELALTGSRLSPQDALAHKQGVAGDPNVVAAQQTLTDANKKLSEAQANIGLTAQKNAIALQQAANSMVSAAAGANAFGLAMSKLNPIQQQFVDFLLQMKPLLDDLKLAASGFLPGLEQGIKNAAPAFAPILTIIGNVAKALGSVFANIGSQFATPQGQKFLTFLSVELPKQIVFLGGLFVDFGKILSGIFEAAAPLIDAFDKAFLGVLDSIGKSANGGGLKTFFDSLIPLVKPTFQFLGSLGSLLGQLFIALAPALAPLLKALAQLGSTLSKIAVPLVKPLALAFIDLVKALLPLLPIFASMVQQLLPPLINFLDQLIQQGVVPLVDALITQLAPQMPGLIKAFTDLLAALIPLIGPITSILVALTPLLPLFVELTVGPLALMTPLIRAATPFISDLAKVLNNVLAPAIRGIIGWFNSINSVVGTVFGTIGHVISSALDGVITIFHNIAGPLGKAFSAVWDGVKTVWNGVEGFFKGIADGIVDVINGLINLLDKIHLHIPKLHIPGTNVNFGGQDIGFNIPDIPYPFAAGGIVQPTPGGTLARIAEAGVAEAVIPLPKLADLVNKLADVKHLRGGAGQPNYFTVYGQSDPVATSHAVANRFAARAT